MTTRNYIQTEGIIYGRPKVFHSAEFTKKEFARRSLKCYYKKKGISQTQTLQNKINKKLENHHKKNIKKKLRKMFLLMVDNLETEQMENVINKFYNDKANFIN
jgi:hypothetical protein